MRALILLVFLLIITSVSAYDLSDFPEPFAENGVLKAKIIVGKDSSIMDAMGGINIISSFEGDEEALTGKLSLYEPIFEIKEAVTADDLEGLKSGKIITDEGETKYTQSLRFKVSNSTELFPTAAIYGENDAVNEEVHDWLYIAEGDNDVNEDAFFEYQIDFEEGLEARIEPTTVSGIYELQDLEDRFINMLGTDFVVVNTELRENCTAPDLKLDFMAGVVIDSLAGGDTVTYTIDGNDYEVSLTFISNPNTGREEAKFSVNGRVLNALAEGQTAILFENLEIGALDILTNARGEGIVEFFIGTNKVELQDTNTEDNSFVNNVQVTKDNVENAWVMINGHCLGDSIDENEEFQITSIKYRLTADAAHGSNLYVKPGYGVRDFLDEPDGMLSPNFDIKYGGFVEVLDHPVSIYARGDDEYRISATNVHGDTYEFPYVEVSSTFRFGEDGEDFLFVENPNFRDKINITGTCTLAEADFFIDQEDKFVIWNPIGLWDESASSHVLEFENVDTSNKEITFDDLSTGSKEFSYRTDTITANRCSAVLGEGEFIMRGNIYKTYLSSGHKVAVDLNSDGRINGDKAKFTVLGGGVIDFDNRSTTPGRTISGSDVLFVLHSPADLFKDASDGAEELEMNITQNGDKLAMAFSRYERLQTTVIDRTSQIFLEDFGAVNTQGRFNDFAFDPQEPDEQENHLIAVTDYGVIYDLFDPVNDPEELTLNYPEKQRGVQVFVVAGNVAISSPSIMAVRPVFKGLAVLDDHELEDELAIVIGGPCVNSVAADLLGNPDNCTDGFEPGKAIINYFPEKKALLVAGYYGADTLAATKVLMNPEKYKLRGESHNIISRDVWLDR
ncbi:hypothetical protein ACFL1B_05280 [Nanoarchaeota archaeon]